MEEILMKLDLRLKSVEADLKCLKQQLETRGFQVHIQKPYDGQQFGRNDKATGMVRPTNHIVKVKLVRTFGMPLFQSVEVQATVNADGSWSAGPFLDTNGNQPTVGLGYKIYAQSETTTGMAADSDDTGLFEVI